MKILKRSKNNQNISYICRKRCRNTINFQESSAFPKDKDFLWFVKKNSNGFSDKISLLDNNQLSQISKFLKFI